MVLRVVLFLLALGGIVFSQEIKVHSPIASVGLFKNGLAVVERVIEVPGSGLYILENIPEAVHGTFWVSSNAKVVEINTRRTKLSQRCHCGRIKKKKLSQRRHECECGVSAQRDLYSAYLARFVDKENHFHADQATLSWSSADSLLQTAWKSTYQSANVSQVRNSFGNPYSQRQSASSVIERIEQSQARNVVRPAESP